MKNFSGVKSILRNTTLYGYIRGVWYRYHDDIPRRRLRKHGPFAINEVNRVLSQARIPYWVDFGSMIGMMRDHGFVKHDDDIDFSLLASSVSAYELYSHLLSCRGFRFSHAFEFRGKITEMTFLYKGIEVDFFFSYICDGRMITPAYNPQPGPYRRSFGCCWMAYGIDRQEVGELVLQEVNGLKAYVPDNYDKLLTECYGNWRTPVKGWCNTKDFGQLPRIRYEDMAVVVNEARVADIGRDINAVL